MALAQAMQRGLHGGAGGEPVVHRDDDAALRVQGRADRRVLAATLANHGQLLLRFPLDPACIGTDGPGMPGHEAPAAFVDGAYGQLQCSVTAILEHAGPLGSAVRAQQLDAEVVLVGAARGTRSRPPA